MAGRYEYAIVGVEDSLRNERLNAAVLVFTEHFMDVVLPKRLDKLRSLSGALDLHSLQSDLVALKLLDAENRDAGALTAEKRVEAIAALTPFTFSSVGSFNAHDADAYTRSVQRIVQLLVEPEAAPPKLVKKRTPLTSALRAALRLERVLARKDEGLSAHRVVSNLQIADGLSADFVLKNGAMHVIETVDASSESISLRKVVSEIAVSALVLEQARMTFGPYETKARLVYEASATVERLANASLEAAEHQGAEIINWASLDDRTKFLSDLTALAEPLPTKREERLAAIHASTQKRFNIN